jgi:hypothetical protein
MHPRNPHSGRSGRIPPQLEFPQRKFTGGALSCIHYQQMWCTLLLNLHVRTSVHRAMKDLDWAPTWVNKPSKTPFTTISCASRARGRSNTTLRAMISSSPLARSRVWRGAHLDFSGLALDDLMPRLLLQYDCAKQEEKPRWNLFPNKKGTRLLGFCGPCQCVLPLY